MSETWRPVVGFEGSYEVSDLGRVRSCERMVKFAASSRSGAHDRLFPGKLLKPGPIEGYPSVVLGRGNTRLVHRLVAAAFLGPCPAGQEVLHRDGSRDNPKLENLRYGTRSDNNRDIVEHGGRKLTVSEVRKVKREVGTYFGSGRALAKALNVSESHISSIKKNRYYKQVRK